MKFEPLTASAQEQSPLREEYDAARRVGKLRLGQKTLFFRAGFRTYYIPYGDIVRYFRRVVRVPAKLCCGKGDLEIENLVICGEAGELAQIQLPGARAGKAVMELMAQLAPQAAAGRPAVSAAQRDAPDGEING